MTDTTTSETELRPVPVGSLPPMRGVWYDGRVHVITRHTACLAPPGWSNVGRFWQAILWDGTVDPDGTPAEDGLTGVYHDIEVVPVWDDPDHVTVEDDVAVPDEAPVELTLEALNRCHFADA
ncbi:hypothetical protein [Euzebya pacifica]|nr:hypothetical protein [Euzebya pacifica]